MSAPEGKDGVKAEETVTKENSEALKAETQTPDEQFKNDTTVTDTKPTTTTEETTTPKTSSEALSPDDTIAVAAMAVAAAAEEASSPEQVVAGEEKNETETTKVKEEEGAAATNNKNGAEEKKEEAAAEKTEEAKEGAPAGTGVSEESPYPYPINMGKDVISGKGGKVQQYNRHFRNLVAEAYASYDATTSKIAKRRIGVAIYQNVIDRGGRFLDAQGKELDRPKAVLKVMKALKDAKTWTSDAKRAAKERRAKLQKGGTESQGKDDKAKEGNGQGSDVKADIQPAETVAAAVVKAPVAPLPAPFVTEKADTEQKTEETKADEAKAKTEPEKAASETEDKKDDAKEGEKDAAAADADDEKATKEEEEKEAPVGANGRPKRASKRRLPVKDGPATKKGKKGEEAVDSTNDAVRGLHLLSQATHEVAKDKKSVQV